MSELTQWEQSIYDSARKSALKDAATAAASVYDEHLKGNPLVRVLTTPQSVLDGAVALIRALESK